MQEFGKTTFISIISKIIKNKKVLIIDFDLINNNIHSIFGVHKYPKELKQKLEDKNFLREFRLSENNLQKLIIKVDKNIDVIASSNIIFDKNYVCKKEKIEKVLSILKNRYNLILIDTTSDTKYEELMRILENCSDNIICLTEGNLIQIKKTINLLEEIRADKIEIVYNKKNKYTMNKQVLEMLFFKFKISGVLNYDTRYNQIINKNVNRLYISKNVKKEYERLIQKLQIK